MRSEYQADLDDVSGTLVAMAALVRSAMSRATQALLTADADLATSVIIADVDVNTQRHRVEEKVYGLLARQNPVAGDLRLLFTALLVASDIERMGDLAKHVAESAVRRHPVRVVPEELAPVIAQMAAVADSLAAKIGLVLAVPDAGEAATLESDDDTMDRLQQQLFVVLLGDTWRHGVEPAVDGALLGRFYERFADHAVNAGRRMVFLVTGELPAPPGEWEL